MSDTDQQKEFLARILDHDETARVVAVDDVMYTAENYLRTLVAALAGMGATHALTADLARDLSSMRCLGLEVVHHLAQAREPLYLFANRKARAQLGHVEIAPDDPAIH